MVGPVAADGSIEAAGAQQTPVPAEALTEVLGGDDDATALVCPDDGTSLTFGQLSEAVADVARDLQRLGIGRGDRVAMVLPNGPELIELVLAATSLGAAAAPLNPAYTVSEFRFFLEDLAPRVLLVASGQGGRAREAADGAITVAEAELRADRPPNITASHRPGPGERAAVDGPGAPEDVALLLHTSGTTSRPKQVPLLQRNLMASTRTIGEHYALGPGDVSFCAMPLFHVHGLVGSTFAQLARGGAVVTPRRLSAKRFWLQAESHRATWVSAGPTTHQMLLEHHVRPVPSIRFVRSCSSALSPALLRRLEDAHGVVTLEAYGMTEASHQIASNPMPPAAREPGSVGIATGTGIRIVDQEWRDVDFGAGEVVISGPGITPGYLGNEQANAESFSQGWFRTGDRGTIEGGYLRLLGRIKEMILRGGENISPYEIEEVLGAHEAVVDAVCFGVDDEKYGQRVGAAVTLRRDVDAEALRAHCRDHLAAFKVPDEVFILDAIPRTATGKVQRRHLARDLTEQHP